MKLYEKYKDRVGFVIIDLDLQRSEAQQSLVNRYFQGSIPHVVVLDSSGHTIYNAAGEVDADGSRLCSTVLFSRDDPQ